MSATTRTTPIAQTITLLEQEIEAIEQRRGELLRVIDALRPLAGDVVRRRSKKAVKRNERTNERATRGPTGRRSRSLPDVTGNGKGAAILATLRQHGGVMTPGALATALKLHSVPTLRYQLKPLVRSKQVVLTGATAGRRVSLPGARAAKEAP